MAQRASRWRALLCRSVLIALLGVASTHVSAAESPKRAAESGTVLHEADGRAYHVERVPKAGAKYEWIDAHTVRYFPFARYQIAGQDAHYLYVKQYIAAAQKSVQAVPPAAQKVELAQTQHLRLRDFGRGLPHSGQWRGDFALADIDADGSVDIVSAPARKSLGKPVILRGDDHGTWKRWPDLAFPPLPYDYGAAVVADFNGDGHADLALGMHLRGLSVLAGDSKGGFTRHDKGLPIGMPGSKTPALYSTHQIGALDWNGDGTAALIAVSDPLLGGTARFGSVSVFVDKGGTWSRVRFAKPELPARNAVLANVAGKRAREAVVVGDDATGAPRAYGFGGGRVVSRGLEGLPASAILRASAAANLGADDELIAVAYQRYTDHGWQSAIDVFRRHGKSLERQALRVEPALSVDALAFGHLRSATAFDLAALRSDGALLLFAADGKGGYTSDLLQPAADWRSGCSGQVLHLQDLDGDGRDEIVAAFAGEPNALMLRRDCVAGGGIEAWQVADAPARQE